MGLFSKIFGKEEPKEMKKQVDNFSLLSTYRPVHYDWYGSIYENGLVRSAIETKARHISKLRVELRGSAKPKLKNRLKHYPNPWMTWSQFLARCSTILDVTNNLFIVPVRDDKTYETIGFFPVLPSKVKLVEDKNGKLWIRYDFANGQRGAVKFDECAYLVKHQYKNDFFGEDNLALEPTMNLISVQEASIKSAVDNSNNYKFIAQVTNFTDPDDLVEERKRFTEMNLKGDDNDGVLLFPNTYGNVREITSKYYTVDTEQMALIKQNVFDYFGINEKIIQGIASTSEMDAYFNAQVEPFAIALAEALSRAIYTDDERSYDNYVFVDANRLQYMSVSEKTAMVQALGDRGALTNNEIREIFNMSPLDNGDVAMVRGEYYPLDQKLNGGNSNEEIQSN